MKILAIDQGTTSTKAFILDDEGELRLVGRLHHERFHPAPGRVEHDAEELASNIESLLDEALRDEPEIAGIALANQGETVVAWDRRNKKPLYRAIVWQDQRTQSMLDELRSGCPRLYPCTHRLTARCVFFSIQTFLASKKCSAGCGGGSRGISRSGYLR